MKAFVFILSLIALSSGSSAIAASTNSAEKWFPNIQDRVRQCSILPYHFDQNNIRVDSYLKSHCPEVKVIQNDGKVIQAKVKVAAHRFLISLIVTEYTDGDFYDVEIRDIDTQDVFYLYNVLAFGDVLLGVLGGNTHGIHSETE